MKSNDMKTVILVLFFLFLSCNQDDHKKKNDDPVYVIRDKQIVVPEKSPLRERLVIQEVLMKSVQTEIKSPATVEAIPAYTAAVTPPVSGRITKLYARFGDAVKKGDILYEMDSPDIIGARTELMRARTVLTQTERNLARQTDLHSHGIIGKKEVEQAETERNAALSDLERATNRLRALGVDPDSTKTEEPLRVRSPISGRVIEVNVAAGEYRSDLNEALLRVANLSSIWVSANVQEKDIGVIMKGDLASIDFAAYPDKKIEGRVESVSDLLDPDTRTTEVHITLPNPEGKFKPGMFATVVFLHKTQPQIVVPTTALVMRGQNSVVYVEREPYVFEPVVVETKERIGEDTVIKSGLEKGMRIVVREGVLLK